MEEQRIGMMYLNSFKRRLSSVWDGLFPRGLRRSPILPLAIIVLVLFVPALGYYLHTRNQFHNIRTNMNAGQVNPDLPRPGGLDPLVLTHKVASGSTTPQFTRVTLLPGLGMDVLQISAYVPGRGDVPLLADPSLKDMADGTAGPRSSPDDLRGALEMPWAGGLHGAVSLLGTTMVVNFMGHPLELPTDPAGQNGVSRGGLFTTRGADSSSVSTDGTDAHADFRAVDFDQHWASTNEIQVMAHLNGNALDLTVMAKNTGSQPEPFGIGWHPRFAVVPGERGQVQLALPTGELMSMTAQGKDLPDGKAVPLSASLQAYAGHPAALADNSVMAVLTHLKAARGEDAPSATLINRRAGYSLRMTALSSTIREFSVSAPSGENYVAMGMQTNYEDPLSKQWTDADPAIVTLQPGETLGWRIRLEITPLP